MGTALRPGASSAATAMAAEPAMANGLTVSEAAAKEPSSGPMGLSLAKQYDHFVESWGPVAVAKWEAMAGKERNRQISIYELVRTELGYVRDLQAIIDGGYNPLSLGELMSDDELSAVFSNVTVLYVMHAKFASLLETEVYKASPFASGVGALLADFAPNILVYSIYANDYPSGSALFASVVAERPGVREALSGDGDSDGARSLQSQLVKPIQRMCKYPLLIREIRKASRGAELADEAALLDTAYEAFSEQLDRVNAHKLAAERQELAVALVGRMTASAVASLELERRLAEKRYVHHGVLDKITSVAKGSYQTRMYVLFNDLLIWFKAKGKGELDDASTRLEFCKSAPTRNVLVNDVPDRTDAHAEMEHMFSVAVNGKDYILRAPNAETKFTWLQHLFEAASVQEASQKKRSFANRKDEWKVRDRERVRTGVSAAAIIELERGLEGATESQAGTSKK